MEKARRGEGRDVYSAASRTHAAGGGSGRRCAGLTSRAARAERPPDRGGGYLPPVHFLVSTGRADFERGPSEKSRGA
jgi:hypothetical protein